MVSFIINERWSDGLVEMVYEVYRPSGEVVKCSSKEDIEKWKVDIKSYYASLGIDCIFIKQNELPLTETKEK